METFLSLSNGIPSHDTFARVFARLDPEAFEASFQQWVTTVVSPLGVQLIAIDGKTVKGSYDREGGIKTLQLVSAWASEHRLVLGQCAVASKSNEITAIPMRQWETIEHTQHQETEAGHHRIETRTIWQMPATQVFSQDQLQQWADLQSVVVVHSYRCLWNKDCSQTRYFLRSLNSDPSTQMPKPLLAIFGLIGELKINSIGVWMWCFRKTLLALALTMHPGT